MSLNRALEKAESGVIRAARACMDKHGFCFQLNRPRNLKDGLAYVDMTKLRKLEEAISRLRSAQKRAKRK